ncbi:hypothetical protein NGRA_3546, partial [Nosema granulosis]
MNIKDISIVFKLMESYDIDFGKKYDFLSSYAFLEKTDKTSVFSPLCSDFNLQLAFLHNEYDEKYIDFADKYLKNLFEDFSKVDTNNFLIANSVYLPSEKSETYKKDYLLEYYKEKNYKEVFKRYQEWFDVQTKGLLKTSLDLDD